jgi:hypothetical protein
VFERWKNFTCNSLVPVGLCYENRSHEAVQAYEARFSYEKHVAFEVQTSGSSEFSGSMNKYDCIYLETSRLKYVRLYHESLPEKEVLKRSACGLVEL